MFRAAGAISSDHLSTPVVVITAVLSSLAQLIGEAASLTLHAISQAVNRGLVFHMQHLNNL